MKYVGSRTFQYSCLPMRESTLVGRGGDSELWEQTGRRVSGFDFRRAIYTGNI